VAASNLTVGRVRGIPIRLHVTFLLVLPFFAYIMAEAYFDRGEGFPGPLALVWGGALAVTLFASVVLHELSHSLTAMRYGVRIKSITLLPIGGVSAMERMPSEPWQERRIALAGPVVNFAIGLPIVAVTRLELIPAIVPQFDTFVGWVGWLNVLLGAFNLFLPAFPMDGGRVLRATLAARMGYDRATGWATGIGRALAFVMGAFGFVMLLRGAGGGIWLLLIAFFIYLGANEEERMVGMTTRLGDLTVERIMTRQPETLSPEATLDVVFDRMLATKHLHFPVTEGDRALGVVGLTDVASVDRSTHPTTRVRDILKPTFPALPPEAPAADALRKLSEGQDDMILVLRDGRLEGIVTRTDVARIVQILGAGAG